MYDGKKTGHAHYAERNFLDGNAVLNHLMVIIDILECLVSVNDWPQWVTVKMQWQ